MALLQKLRDQYCYSPIGAYHKLHKTSFPVNGISNAITFSGYLQLHHEPDVQVPFLLWALYDLAAFFIWAEATVPGIEYAAFKT